MNIFWSSFFKSLLPIGIFGILGVFSRYSLGLLFQRFFSSPFPWGTFTINALGSFLIGMVFTLGHEKGWLSPSLRLGIMIGFLGGFTTFSSFSLETISLFEKSRWALGFCYLILSPVVGTGLCACGMLLARQW